MLSPEMNIKVMMWREKAARGELTLEEMREAVEALRQGRMTAATDTEAKRKKTAKKEVRTADDLLAGLL